MSGARWTDADLRRVMDGRAFSKGKSDGAPKTSKYRNVRVVVDGQTFDSKAEAAYWQTLKLREKAGEIQGLQRQVQFMLFAPVIREDGTITYEAIHVSTYVADFVWYEGMKRVVADKKGKRTAMYLLKRKWLELQSGIKILEV